MTTPNTKSKTKRTVFTIILATLFLLFFIFAFFGYHKLKLKFSKVNAMGVKPIAIKTITLNNGSLTKTVTSLGQLQSIVSVHIKSEIQGKVTKLSKREGDLVSKGEIIANINPSESVSQLKSAYAQTKAASGQVHAMAASIVALQKQRVAIKTNLSFQKKQKARDKRLFKTGAISSTQLEKTENMYAEASSKLSSLDAQIAGLKSQKSALIAKQDASKQSVELWEVRNAYSIVRSPVDGVISSRLIEEGDFARPGNPLFTIESSSGKKLVIKIPQDKAIFIKLGQIVLIDGSTVNATIPKFRIKRIYPKLNNFNQMIVEAETETEYALPPLPVGIQLPVKIIIEEQSGVVIPFASSFNANTISCNLYQVENDRANIKNVSVKMFDNMGNAIIDKEIIDTAIPVISASYLTDKRLPASFPVELVK